MPGLVKYLINESGQKTSVLVPVKVWDDLNANYQKLQEKVGIMTSIQKGLAEVRNSRKTNREFQTLTDFLKIV